MSTMFRVGSVLTAAVVVMVSLGACSSHPPTSSTATPTHHHHRVACIDPFAVGTHPFAAGTHHFAVVDRGAATAVFCAAGTHHFTATVAYCTAGQDGRCRSVGFHE